MAFGTIKERLMGDLSNISSLSAMEKSFDVRKSINRLQKHSWQWRDLQYGIMIPTFIFCLFVAREPPFILRIGLGMLIGLGLLLPITSQFLLPALPILTWLFLFYSAQFIPATWRPCIFVRVLPAWETILYGGNLSQVLSQSQNAFLDLLAWVPYGLVHYGAPFVTSIIFFVFGPPSTLPAFGFAFGWMNFTAVTIQLMFPSAPPWYLNEYGLDPASYDVQGSPAGLARVDKLLGLNMYTDAFHASPLVFGAFPSLHSAFAVLQVLFLCHLFPAYSAVFFLYILWIWWSTMYLAHHYFIDLIAGACLAFTMFYLVRLSFLPRIQSGKLTRWSYDFIERGIHMTQVKLRKSIDDDDDEEYIELPTVGTLLGSGLSRTGSPALGSSSSGNGISQLQQQQLNKSFPHAPASPATKHKNSDPHSHSHSHSQHSSSLHLHDGMAYATTTSTLNNNNTEHLDETSSTGSASASNTTASTRPGSPLSNTFVSSLINSNSPYMRPSSPLAEKSSSASPLKKA